MSATSMTYFWYMEKQWSRSK